ncbi:YceI family protein [Fontimonas sp. SYSU GA230001]|uniref:YceI family protein n=1 Tax=Fontimonas sp. SYSU GA230001 TaxID=3142450 RepID=UPI0032B5FC0E
MKRVLAVLALSMSGPLAAADTYVIDPAHTLPSFEVSHFGFSTTRGGFTRTEGTITLDLKKKTGAIDVRIDAASLQTAVPKLDAHLKNPDFFDVEMYPAITFKSKSLKFDGDRLVAVTGDLDMHGVSKPVTLEVTHFRCGEHPIKKVPHCGADAVATIKRSDWGITTYSPAIGEDVTLKIQVEASRQ